MIFNVKGVDIDLRKETKELITNYGYNVLLVRRSNMLCSCAAAQGQQSTPFCTKCMGLGRKIRIEIVKMIGQRSSQVINRPTNIQYGELGEIYSDSRGFCCEYNVHPNLGSLILEVSWSKSGKPLKIIGAYKIAYNEPLRMENGRIEFYVLATHREMTNIAFKEEVLKNSVIYNKNKKQEEKYLVCANELVVDDTVVTDVWDANDYKPFNGDDGGE